MLQKFRFPQIFLYYSLYLLIEYIYIHIEFISIFFFFLIYIFICNWFILFVFITIYLFDLVYFIVLFGSLCKVYKISLFNFNDQIFMLFLAEIGSIKQL